MSDWKKIHMGEVSEENRALYNSKTKQKVRISELETNEEGWYSDKTGFILKADIESPSAAPAEVEGRSVIAKSSADIQQRYNKYQTAMKEMSKLAPFEPNSILNQTAMAPVANVAAAGQIINATGDVAANAMTPAIPLALQALKRSNPIQYELYKTFSESKLYEEGVKKLGQGIEKFSAWADENPVPALLLDSIFGIAGAVTGLPGPASAGKTMTRAGFKEALDSAVDVKNLAIKLSGTKGQNATLFRQHAAKGLKQLTLGEMKNASGMKKFVDDSTDAIMEIIMRKYDLDYYNFGDEAIKEVLPKNYLQTAQATLEVKGKVWEDVTKILTKANKTIPPQDISFLVRMMDSMSNDINLTRKHPGIAEAAKKRAKELGGEVIGKDAKGLPIRSHMDEPMTVIDMEQNLVQINSSLNKLDYSQIQNQTSAYVDEIIANQYRSMLTSIIPDGDEFKYHRELYGKLARFGDAIERKIRPHKSPNGTSLSDILTPNSLYTALGPNFKKIGITSKVTNLLHIGKKKVTDEQLIADIFSGGEKFLKNELLVQDAFNPQSITGRILKEVKGSSIAVIKSVLKREHPDLSAPDLQAVAKSIKEIEGNAVLKKHYSQPVTKPVFTSSTPVPIEPKQGMSPADILINAHGKGAK